MKIGRPLPSAPSSKPRAAPKAPAASAPRARASAFESARKPTLPPPPPDVSALLDGKRLNVALKKARELLHSGGYGGTHLPFAEPLETPLGAMQHLSRDEQPERLVRQLAKSARAAVPEPQQATWDAVMAQLEGNPTAQLALQTMALEGRLGPELLTQLGELAQTSQQSPYKELLAQTIREIAVPACICQGDKNTCGATSAAIMLAMENPAEYVRLLDGLARDGRVETLGGDTLVREFVPPDGSQRTLSQQLLAPALMELGNGDGDYVNGESGTDTNTTVVVSVPLPPPLPGELGLRLPNIPGLMPNGAEDVLESILGRDFQTTLCPPLPANWAEMGDAWLKQVLPPEVYAVVRLLPGDVQRGIAEQINQAALALKQPALDAVHAAMEANGSAMVALDVATDGTASIAPHWVVVTDISRGADGQLWVTITNPWGLAEQMPYDEFQRRLWAAETSA